MTLTKINELNLRPEAADSHAGATRGSRLALNFRESVTMPGNSCPAISPRVYYPRVKRCADKSYLMLMQDGRVSASVYYAKSADGLYFSARAPLFTSKTVLREDGEEDRLCYASADAIVKKDGVILAFVSYRYNKGYSLDAKYSGILMRRSEDNGVSWGAERLIYLGRNWEPSAIERPDGELHLYFSHTAPKFYLDPTVRTDSKIHTSSGSAMLRSRDGGEHWTPDVMGPPYAADRVTQNYVYTMENGTRIFTNQMPVGVSLNNGSIALATESDMALGRFLLTMSYSDDNWKTPLGIDEDGPADKAPAFTFGAGPYMAQFPSGETVLSYNTEDRFHIRLGDERGKDFCAERETVAFGGREGYWGCVLADTPHSLLAYMPNVRETKDAQNRTVSTDNDMMAERYYLNHAVRAPRYTGENSWEDNGDALFVGSLTRTQVSVRAAYDDEYIYLRADRLDDQLDRRDGEKLFLCDKNGGFATADYSLEGELYATAGGRQCRETECRSELFGELDGKEYSGNGAVTVTRVPRRFFEGKVLGLCVKLSDYRGDSKISECLAGVDENDLSTYIPLILE